MPLFSLVTLTVVIYYVVKNNNIHDFYVDLIKFTCLIEIMHIRGYFIPVGESGILTQSTYLRYLLVLCGMIILFIGNIKYNRKLIIFTFLFFVSALLGEGIEYVFPYEIPVVPYSETIIGKTGSTWDYFMQGYISKRVAILSMVDVMKYQFELLVVLFNIVIIKSYCNMSDYRKILAYIVKVFPLYIILLFIEFIIKNLLGFAEVWPDIQQSLFGNFSLQAMGSESKMRGDLYTLIGFSQESSYVVMAISAFWLLSLYAYKSNIAKLKMKWVVLSILLFLLCGGFSCYWFGSVLLVIMWIIIKEKYRLTYRDFLMIILSRSILFMSLILVLLSMIFYFYDYAYDKFYAVLYFFNEFVLEGRIPYWLVSENISVLSRMGSIVTVINDFCERPLFGLGMGVEYAHSFTVTMLAEFGVVGTVLWWLIITCKKRVNEQYDIYTIFIFFIIAGIFGGDFGVKNLQFIYYIIIVESTKLYTILKTDAC